MKKLILFPLLLLCTVKLCLTKGQFNQYRSLIGGANLCVGKQSCSECLQTPTCAWCIQPDYVSADGLLKPRCNNEEYFRLSGEWNTRGMCEARYLVNPMNVFTILENLELRSQSSYEVGFFYQNLTVLLIFNSFILSKI